MNNPLPLRLLMIVVIPAAIGAGFLAYAKMQFPVNAIVIAFSAAAIAGVFFFVTRQEKAARFDVYFGTVQALGQPLSFGSTTAAFERNGTRFDVEFPQGKYHLHYTVTFYLPNLREKFSVQNKSLATTHHNDCYWIEAKDSPLPPEYLLQSRRPDFLFEVLENRRIRDEILSYDASMWSRISLSVDDGHVELIWTPPVSEQLDGFRRIAHSAAVFHDELQKFPSNI